MNAAPKDPPNEKRRSFFKETLAVIIGGLVTVIPMGAGLMVYLDPIRKNKKASSTGAIRVAALSALPDDGIPRRFPVIADKVDAWNKYPQIPVGAVYLLRKGDKVTALNMVCPHAGCAVDYNADSKCYLCPCHNSTFALDGSINDKKSPSPRGMDPLDVEVRGEEIFVNFKNFRAGTHDRIPEA